MRYGLYSVINNLIISLAGYVQSISRGDGTIILSSGFDVHNGRTQLRQTETPANINGKTGHHDGEISLSWDPIPRAKAYNIQMSSDGLNNWTYYGSATKSRMLIAGLDSGVKCFFRVAAIGPLGQGGWSDPGFGRSQ